MADQVPWSSPEPFSSDIDPSTGGPSVVQLVRHDTISSTGSAKPTPKGYLDLALSGNCPRCHHHHKSIKVQVTAGSDSNHVGEVKCEKCDRLWLDFGRRNSTRLSLLSMQTIEPDRSEEKLHSTLLQMIRSATAVATLSSTLADIPESSTAGLAREPTVPTTLLRGVQHLSQSDPSDETAKPVVPPGNTAHVQDASPSTYPSAPRRGTSLSRTRAVGTSQLVSRLKQKIREKLPVLETLRLGRWKKSPEVKELSPNRYGKQPAYEAKPLPEVPSMHAPEDHSVEAQRHADASTETEAIEENDRFPSTAAAEELKAPKTLDQEAVRAMTLEQRIAWMRGQITNFKHQATPAHSSTVPTMADTGVQVDEMELQPASVSPPPTRPHSELAGFGNTFGSFYHWQIFRGSNATLNGRPLSMSETHLSDADTAVEGMSVNSAPRHILVESLQRDRRGSSTSRPRSLQGIVQNWQQIHQNRLEARRSFDSAATGGVRSIPSARGRALNRLSRTSMARPSTIYFTEPATSQVQLPLPTNEESEPSNDQEHYISSLPSPPTPQ